MGDYHIKHKLKETLTELKEEFSPYKILVKTINNYPEMKVFALIDVLERTQLATVTISPHQLTVLDCIKKTAHTFISPETDVIRLVEAMGLDPHSWASLMARHSNNNDVDECYSWDWESFDWAVYCQLSHWEKNLRDAPQECVDEFAPVKAACEEVTHVAPSLPDVRVLERKWPHVEYELFSYVPVDDYFVWDRGFIQALVIIEIISEATGTKSSNQQTIK